MRQFVNFQYFSEIKSELGSGAQKLTTFLESLPEYLKIEIRVRRSENRTFYRDSLYINFRLEVLSIPILLQSKDLSGSHNARYTETMCSPDRNHRRFAIVEILSNKG